MGLGSIISIGFRAIAILVFVAILIIIAIKTMKKSKIIGDLIIAFIIVIIILSIFIIPYRYEDSIGVFTLNKNLDDPYFRYKVLNRRIWYEGSSEKFAVGMKKEDFFNDLENEYEIFDKDDDKLMLIYNHEIFTVVLVSEKLLESEYLLYSEYLIFEEDDVTYDIPFPTGVISGLDELSNVISSKFQADCSIDYLKEFYMNYKDVEIVDKQIQYKNIILTIQDDEYTMRQSIRISINVNKTE